MKPVKFIPWLLVILIAAFACGTVLAQESSTGSLEGRVTDDKGSAVPGATISATGAQGTMATRSGPDGSFRIPFLKVGTYDIKVEMPGYATMIMKDVQIALNRRTSLPILLSSGRVETVTVTAQAPLIDVKQTSVGSNIKVDRFVNYVPIGRTYSDTFLTVPGVVGGGGTGAGNFSISGASGLENQYIVDGVNITNTGYGGIGAYNIVYGSLGTGVTTDFLEEVQVKTGGFEAEYSATGGVLNTIVKSGTNKFSGSISTYYSPRGMQMPAKTVTLTTGAVSFYDENREELGLTFSGPIVKDKLFFFAAFNPVRTKTRMTVEDAPFDSDFAPAGVGTFPAAELGPQEMERRTNNWAAKLSWYMTPNHRLEMTGFGDPSHGLEGPQNPGSLRYLDYEEGGGQTDLRYGGTNYALKYNGVFTPNFFGEFQVSVHDAKFRETAVKDWSRVRFREQQLCFLYPLLRCPAGVTADAGTTWFTGGPAFISNADDENMAYSMKLTNVISPWNLELRYGVEYADIGYSDNPAYSGAPTDYFIPVDGAAGFPLDGNYDVGEGLYITSNTGQSIDKRGATNYRVTRNRFNPFPGETKTSDLNFFAQGTWNVTPRVIIKPGLRVTSQKIEGAGDVFTLPFTVSSADNYRAVGTTTYTTREYKFETEWAPRIGVTWDVTEDGRSKAYVNWGRYFERVPNDLAVRALSTEIGMQVYRFEGLGPNNTPINPRPLTTPSDAIYWSGLDPTVVEPGTRLPYKDEYVAGYAYQLRPNLAVEIRGIYRKQGRALEDVQYTTNEQIQNLYYGYASGYYPYDPFGGSLAQPVSPTYPAKPFGAYNLVNPGEGESKKYGFPKPSHTYKALELTLNKALSDNWLLVANYRYSKLRGNYEGLFRNDNGQSDPNITSLLDFPNSPTMRGQFQEGTLNLDRPNVLNIYGAYVWKNGLMAGAAMKWASGTPRTALLAHPNYQNAGEIPGINPIYFWWADDAGTTVLRKGSANAFFNDPDSLMVTPVLYDYTDCKRGCLGRTPDVMTLDLNLSYDWKIKDTTLNLALTVFNIFDD